ncbi:MAG: fibronectin type III domain-containing protein [Actinomycetota bacterium]|nr:fibronectin type III domain-containing protein [Actinomycetota bacterium]
MRRLAATAATALIVVLVTAGTAAAAVTASVTSPGTKIDGPAAVAVRVDRDLTDSVTAVGVRLRSGGREVRLVEGLECQGCKNNPAWTTSDWAGKTLNPSGLPNGTYHLHPVVDGKEFGGREVWISVPPSPVSNLKTSVSGQDVTVTWTRAPEPDISAYRVQRRISGGAWQQIASVGPGADRYAERLSPGTYEYRIVTVRPDGNGGHIAVTSPAVAAAVKSPPPPTQPSETSGGGSTEGTGGSTSGGSTSGSTDGSTGGSDGGSTGATGETTTQPGSGTATGDPASADGEGTAGDGPQDAPSEASTTQPSVRTAGAGRRVAPPPGVRRSLTLKGFDLSLPDPQVAGPRERFYGQDQPFSEELDYGDIDPITGEPRVREGTAMRRVPGAVQEFIVARLNAPLVAIPAAAGLLCIALGLHGMRWLRQG